jgi:hypothetical protein
MVPPILVACPRPWTIVWQALILSTSTWALHQWLWLILSKQQLSYSTDDPRITQIGKYIIQWLEPYGDSWRGQQLTLNLSWSDTTLYLSQSAGKSFAKNWIPEHWYNTRLQWFQLSGNYSYPCSINLMTLWRICGSESQPFFSLSNFKLVGW